MSKNRKRNLKRLVGLLLGGLGATSGMLTNDTRAAESVSTTRNITESKGVKIGVPLIAVAGAAAAIGTIYHQYKTRALASELGDFKRKKYKSDEEERVEKAKIKENRKKYKIDDPALVQINLAMAEAFGPGRMTEDDYYQAMSSTIGKKIIEEARLGAGHGAAILKVVAEEIRMNLTTEKVKKCAEKLTVTSPSDKKSEKNAIITLGLEDAAVGGGAGISANLAINNPDPDAALVGNPIAGGAAVNVTCAWQGAGAKMLDSQYAAGDELLPESLSFLRGACPVAVMVTPLAGGANAGVAYAGHGAAVARAAILDQWDRGLVTAGGGLVRNLSHTAAESGALFADIAIGADVNAANHVGGAPNAIRLGLNGDLPNMPTGWGNGETQVARGEIAKCAQKLVQLSKA